MTGFTEEWLAAHTARLDADRAAKLKAPVGAGGGKRAQSSPVLMKALDTLAKLPLETKRARVQLELDGHCPAKKSLYRRGKRGLFLDADVAAQIQHLQDQAEKQWKRSPVEHPALAITFYVRSRRSDRDGKLATVLDVLQKAGVLTNDNVMRCNGELLLRPAIVDAKERVVIEIGVSTERKP